MMQEDSSDGIITQGTTIIVRAGISGKPVLRIITKIDERCSKLVIHVLDQCAAVLDVPRLCIHIRWLPPVPLQIKEATCVAGFSLNEHRPAVAKKKTPFDGSNCEVGLDAFLLNSLTAHPMSERSCAK